jgi:hypothetical protein
MGKYLFAYTGGSMAQTDAEREAAMAAWGAWFGQLGPAVVDGGNPFGASTSVGSGSAGSLSGYSIVEAGSLQDASKLAEGCPVLAHGGGVQVYETFEVM